MRRRSMRVAFAAALALVLLALAGAALAAAPTVKKVEYDGGGKVEVKFGQKVRYAKGLRVSVKDAAGKAYGVKIHDKASKELEFSVKNFRSGAEYTYEIAGVYRRGTSNNGAKLGGGFAIPDAKPVVVQKAEYKGNGKVEIDFGGKVEYKNLSVTAKCGGLTYAAKVKASDSNGLTLSFPAIAARPGDYEFTISGVRVKASGDAYGAVSGSFSVPEIKPVQVKKVQYRAEDLSLAVYFAYDVAWKSPKATIADASGKRTRVNIIARNSGECVIRCTLVEGHTYTLTVEGIRAEGAFDFRKVTHTFVAYDD